MKKWTLFAALCACTAGQSFGALVTELAAGAGNTAGTAQAIANSDFTTPIPATVFPGLGLTATVQGGLQTSDDVDFYSFSVLGPGAVANFDMDNNPFTVDTMLFLFNGIGSLLAYDDDSFAADNGSASGLDAYLGSILLTPGSYYIAVSRFPNFAIAASNNSGVTGLLRPDGIFGGWQLSNGLQMGGFSFGSNALELAALGSGSAYNLHISLNSVPEPSSMALMGLGMVLAGVANRRLRR